MGLSIWLWTDAPARLSATATDGLTMRLTAQWTSTTFEMGDGQSRTCTATTPYPEHPETYGSPSPTCGYTYRKRSKPGADYTVTATTQWRVSWSAGGRSGTLVTSYAGQRNWRSANSRRWSRVDRATGLGRGCRYRFPAAIKAESVPTTATTRYRAGDGRRQLMVTDGGGHTGRWRPARCAAQDAASSRAGFEVRGSLAVEGVWALAGLRLHSPFWCRSRRLRGLDVSHLSTSFLCSDETADADSLVGGNGGTAQLKKSEAVPSMIALSADQIGGLPFGPDTMGASLRPMLTHASTRDCRPAAGRRTRFAVTMSPRM